jgi:hypothetical protein
MMILIFISLFTMKSNDPKYITSSAPINSRTTPSPKKEPQLSPELHKRRLQTQLKHRIGMPLTEQAHRSKHPSINRKKNSLILTSICFALAIVSLILGTILSSMFLIASGVVCMVLALTFFYHQTKKGKQEQNVLNFSNEAVPLFDLASLEKFDNALNLVALEVSEDIVVQLIDIKQQIVKLHQLYSKESLNEHFTQEDKMYVIEAVRRYLPDSLQAYLRIPHEQRNQILPQNQYSSRQMLSHQLELIANELGKREAKLKTNAAVDLIKQQHFLESKTSTTINS